MRCEEADGLIEALAAGDVSADAALGSHVDTCARCRERLALARAIESMLAVRETPEPPARFTAAVMGRLIRERWRAEQLLDAGFNVAVAAGLLLIVGGIGGLAWSLGFIGADSTIVYAISASAGQLTERLLPQAQTVGLASLLLISALGLWWWAEEGFA